MEIHAVFEVTEPPAAGEIRLYAALRDKETNALVKITLLTLDENYTALITGFEEMKVYNLSFYVWDNEMKPLMDIQKYEVNTIQNEELPQ